MSNLAMTQTEEKTIDSQIEQMMDWAKTRSAEAEQLALDSARLMACTTDRVDRLKNQGFFKRCWNRFSGKAGEMERANTNDLIQMQKMAFRYVNMLQEQQLLMAHSLLSLKNNLISLAVKEEETRNLIGMLAQRTLERFEKLENRVDQLEISTNLQGWLLGLEEREYNEKIPTEYMRLFRVINDFYNIKKDNWNYNDLMFMRKAIRTVGLNPKQKISLNSFIDKLTDEIQSEGVGFEAYGHAITTFKPEGIGNYSKYVIENISSPVFVSMHGLKTQYIDRLDIVEELQDEMNISAGEALKRLLRRSINNMNVNLEYEFPLAETAIEILGCLRLAEKLASPQLEVKDERKKAQVEKKNQQLVPNGNRSSKKLSSLRNNVAEPEIPVEVVMKSFEDSEDVQYEITSTAMRETGKNGFFGMLTAVLGGWTYGAKAVIESVHRAYKNGTIGNVLIVNDDNVASLADNISADTVIAYFKRKQYIPKITAKVLVLSAEKIDVGEVRVSQAVAIITSSLKADRLLINHGDILAPDFKCRIYNALDDRLYTKTQTSLGTSPHTENMFDVEAKKSLNRLLETLNGSAFNSLTT